MLNKKEEVVVTTGNRCLPSWTSCESGVDHLLVVDAEHVDPPVLSREEDKSFYFYGKVCKCLAVFLSINPVRGFFNRILACGVHTAPLL